MPKLSRARFSKVGPSNARMEDLILDFRDADGQPADTTLWLRNGGGKTTLLTLFLTLFSPDLRRVHGLTGGEQYVDYFLREDRSVIAVEWLGDETGPDGEPLRYLTGMFCEWGPGSTQDASNLRRLFFSARVQEDVEELTLDGLPLYVRTDDDSRARRTLNNFRQEWAELRKEHPQAGVMYTRNLSAWKDHLEGLGLDPELSYYQMVMNQEEGGTADLIDFESDEECVDFLLDTVLKPDIATEAAKNIRSHREKLRRRHRKLLPEKDLVEGLIQRMEPFQELRGERIALFRRVAGAREELDVLDDALQGLEQTAREDLEDARHRIRELEAEAEEAAADEAEARDLAALFRWGHWRRKLDRLKDEHAELAREHREAQRAKKTWDVADYLYEVRRWEQKVEELQQEIDEQTREHRPLREKAEAAARAYVAALKDRHQGLSAVIEETEGAIQAAKASAAEARKRESSLERSIGELNSTLDNVNERLESAQSIRADLVERNVLPGEDVDLDRAEERLAGWVADARQERSEEQERQAEREAERESLADRAAELREERATRLARKEQLEADLAEAREAREVLESHQHLPVLLEVHELDLEEAGKEPLRQLRSVEQSTIEKLVDLKLARAEDERALHSLRENERLPLPPAAERTLTALRQASITAWGAPYYLMENLPGPDAVRAKIRARPAAAFGVVVREKDLPDVREMLDEGELDLDQPVTITSARALIGEDEHDGSHALVVGPTGDAHFSREAARAERDRRELDRDRLDEDIEATERRRRQAAELARRFETYFEMYPARWYSETRKELTAVQDALADLDEEAQELEVRRDELEAEIQEGEETLAALRQRIQALVTGQEDLRRYRDRFPGGVPKLEEGQSELQHDLNQKRTTLRQLRKRQEELEATLEEHRASLNACERERSQIDRNLDEVRFVTVTDVEPEPGDTESLRQTYRRRVESYEGEVGERALLRQQKEAQDEARSAREQYDEALARYDDLEEGDVASALDQLDDPGRVGARRAKADEAEHRAMSRKGNKQQRVTAAEERLSQAEEAAEGYTLSRERLQVHAPDLDEEALDTEAGRQGTLADQAAARAEEARAAADGAEGDLRELKHQVEKVQMAREGVKSTRVPYKGLFDELADLREQWDLSDLDADPEVAREEPSSLEAAKDRLEQVKGVLGEAQDTQRSLNRKRELNGQEVQTWVSDDRFEGLKLKQKFQRLSPRDLELTVPHRRELLEERLQTLESRIEQIDQDRDQIISYLLSSGQDGIQALKSIDRKARVPDDVAGLGGTRFLKIHLREITDTQEQRGRIGNMLDDLTEEGEDIPEGTGLVQEAVRRLTRSIRVEVLVPNRGQSPEYRRAARYGTLSTGEGVTASIMLYCTLASLRAKERGVRKPSDVLILDNPIGKASRAKFLELQREVARAMNIQLVYATGINDLEAVCMLPHRIRLRNDQVDRRTSHQLLTVDRKPVEGLQATHLGQRTAPRVPEPSVRTNVGGGS